MNDQSAFRVANLGPASAAPTGAVRLKMLVMGAAATGGLMIGVGLYAAQLILPTFLHPSVVAGKAAGETEKADIDTKQATVIAYERGKADAVAQGQAKGQVDVMVMQKTLDTTTESLAAVNTMASLADASCAVGNIIASLSAPTGRVIGDWRNGRTDYDTADLNHVANAVAGTTCGMSAPLRQSVLATQLDAVRTVAAARGMSMTNGAVQVAGASDYSAAIRPATPMPTVERPASPVPAAPVQVATVQPVQEHAVTKARNAAWTPEQQSQLRLYSYHLSVDVLHRLGAGLDVGRGYPETWYDRVAAYQAAHQG